MNTVRLYFIKHRDERDLAQIDTMLEEQWLSELSSQKQASIRRLLFYRNRMTSLSGLRLLNICAQDEGLENFKLSDVQYPEAGKPFWENNNVFYDFNISHSGNFILVAASTTLKVGIDVEEIRPLKRLSFKRVMSADELVQIQQRPILFFDLWSKKEAVVKAANTVGLACMSDVKLKQDVAMLDGKTWYLKSVDLDKQYAINLASSDPADELIVKQLQLADLK